MNKAELNQKLSDLEDEAAKLRSLINQPEQREPEAGDVWANDTFSFLLGRKESFNLTKSEGGCFGLDELPMRDEDTYLGKFDEVFVKISDVRDALSLRDGYDNNILEWLEDGDLEPRSGSIIKTYEALLNLNIIK